MLGIIAAALLAFGVWMGVSAFFPSADLARDLGVARRQERSENLVQRVARKDREEHVRFGDYRAFAIRLRMADVPMTPEAYWTVMGLGAVFVALVGLVLVSAAAAAILGVGMLAAGYLFVERRAQAAEEKLRGQAASLIGTVGSAMKSGASIQTAVRRASEMLPPPLGTEVQALLAQVAVRREPMSHLFARLSVWLRLPALGMFANALDIAEREKTSGMGDIMIGIADDMRKTQAMEIERRSKLNAHVRTFNMFLAAPVLSIVAIVFFEPSMWQALTHTAFGIVVLIAEAVTVPGAYLWMRSETSTRDILAR
ncbi:MAG: hypothetical protein K6V73_06330 [Firmicutes bacterium]|nr:hypothetical protein [Bacillota bacterium]